MGIAMDALGIDLLAAGTAWLLFSVPLIVTVFFRFGRVWSIRNFDLLLLLGVAIGVALVRSDRVDDVVAISVLLSSTGILLARLLCDDLLQKRPRIESNLNPHALAFLGMAAAAALTASIIVTPLPRASEQTLKRGQEMLSGEAPLPRKKEEVLTSSGPASTIATAPVLGISSGVAGQQQPEQDIVAQSAAGILAGLGHLAVLGALMFIGVRHFHDWNLSLALATLYLLLPSTVLDPNSVNHILSAAWILWALALYRVPWASGVFVGLACGSLLYPALLLPIWFAFYGRKHSLRFAVALVGVWALLLGTFAIVSMDVLLYVQESLQLIARGVAFLVDGKSPLTWRITDELYRAPIFGTFVVMLIGLTVWPRTKRFEHLLAASAATIVGVQFWYPQQVGDYLTGYIPLVILVAFRPRLHQSSVSFQRSTRADADHNGERTQRQPSLTGAGHSAIFR